MDADKYFKKIPIHELVRLYNNLKNKRYRKLDEQLLFDALENYLWDEYRL